MRLYIANISLNFTDSDFRLSKVMELGILHLQFPSCQIKNNKYRWEDIFCQPRL